MSEQEGFRTVKSLVRAVGSNRARFASAVVVIGLLALTLSGCDTDTPQNTFDTRGDVADKQANLFYLAMWPALVIMIGVLGGILLIALRYRERDPNAPPPKQVHGNTRLELAWTIAPALLLVGLGVPMVAMIGDLDSDPGDDAYTIDVIGQRYSWIFEYPEELDSEGNPLTVFDGTVHIPVDQKVNFRLRSVDVIHSFWIPKLGGKRDVFPCLVREVEGSNPIDEPQCEGGQLNSLWLIADEAGSYSGQCAEYCGLDHAIMSLTVIADEEDDFQAWLNEAQGDDEPAEEETDAPAEEETEAPTETAPASPTGDATESPTGEATESSTGEATETPTGDATESPTGEATETPTDGGGG